MLVIKARNVHEAFPKGLSLVTQYGARRESRVGSVLSVDEPVSVEYECPTERVIFWKDRDANPFFHFFESLWMLAGRDDVRFVAKFNKRMEEFSDDGETLRGAYGHRWRAHWNYDQFELLISILKNYPNTRRAVLQMWDPDYDQQPDESVKDVCCNLSILFRRNFIGQQLDMTVYCRSSDIVWGMFGANAVHFSMLQEYIAAMVGIRVGRFTHVTNDFHAYLDTIRPVMHLAGVNSMDPYSELVKPYPIVQKPETWLSDLHNFLEQPSKIVELDNPFFSNVAVPLWLAFHNYKIKQYGVAREYVSRCAATDWRLACMNWLDQREENAKRRMAQGTDRDPQQSIPNP